MMKNFSYSEYHQQGFTLIEMIVVIVITGIIGGMVAMFIRAPVEGYVDSARRAEMTDVADTAVRRISRDLRLALPNSVRVTPDGLFLEFIPTASGGRYRSVAAGGTGACAAVPGNSEGDALSFAFADTCFETIGPLPLPLPAIGDQVVVYNLGIPGADAYSGNALAADNRRTITAVGANSISIATATPFPLDACQLNVVTGGAIGCRFQVVNTPVTYVCAPAAGGVGGTLTRYWGYAIQDIQTKTDSIAELNALVNPPNATRGSALLANNVGLLAGGGCNFTYNPNVVAQRMGIVTMALSLTQAGESVSLFSATHVSNVP